MSIEIIKAKDKEIFMLVEEKMSVSMKATAELQTSHDNSKQLIQKLESQKNDVQKSLDDVIQQDTMLKLEVNELNASLDRAEHVIHMLQSNQKIMQMEHDAEIQRLKNRLDLTVREMTSIKEDAVKEMEHAESILKDKDEQIQHLQEALNEQKLFTCHCGMTTIHCVDSNIVR